MTKEELFARAAAVAAVAITVVHLFWIIQGLRDAQMGFGARASLRKLAALTIRNFPDRNLDSAELFWKSIGREGDPMHDAWGTEYRMTSQDGAGQKVYFWSSAGPDRRFGTRDDVIVTVPYPNGALTSPDLAPGEPSATSPESIDAK